MRIVLDSNIFVSAFVFGGKPAKCIDYVVQKKVTGVVSSAILTEVLEVLAAKFSFSSARLEEINFLIDNSFEKVFPDTPLNISRDPDDNRVLEAAEEGECDYIVTGDEDLLALGKYKNIATFTPAEFLTPS